MNIARSARRGLSRSLVSLVCAAAAVCVGCKNEDVASGPATQQAAAGGGGAAAPAAGQLAGMWRATKVEGAAAAGLPAGLKEEMLLNYLLLGPDNTYLSFSNAGAQSRGTWSNTGSAIELTPAESFYSKSKFEINGADLVDAGPIAVRYQKQPAADASATTSVTVRDLLKQLEGDGAAAKALDGKVIELEGVVSGIVSRSGDPHFFLAPVPAEGKAPSVGPSIVSAYPRDDEFWSSLAPGQRVKVTGPVMVRNFAAVYFAEFEPVGDPVVTRMPAADLAREWKADKTATEKKYQSGSYGKPLILEGKLLEKKMTDSGAVDGLFIGDGEDRVFCGFGTEEKTQARLSKLKEGEPVKMAATFGSFQTRDYLTVDDCRLITKK